MADITIVNGVYKPTYNWGGTILHQPVAFIAPTSVDPTFGCPPDHLPTCPARAVANAPQPRHAAQSASMALGDAGFFTKKHRDLTMKMVM